VAGVVDPSWRPPPPRSAPPKPAPRPVAAPATSAGVYRAASVAQAAPSVTPTVRKRKEAYNPQQAALGGLQAQLELPNRTQPPLMEPDPESPLQDAEAGFLPGVGGTLGGSALGGLSSLRQGMGNRLYPMESSALAGLRKAY
jgi:hypothetical protein